jgi:hypothetical protein
LGDDAIDDPLCIIHDMDRFDKHRELTIVTGIANLTFPNATPDLIAQVWAYKHGKMMTSDEAATALSAIKHDAIVVPEIAFAKFGKREEQFVTPSLSQLLHATRDVMNLFWLEL